MEEAAVEPPRSHPAWVAQPVGWPTHLASATVGLLLLSAWFTPGWYFVLPLALFSACVLAAYWALRLVLHRSRTGRIARAFWVGPILAALTLGGIAFDGPTRVKWAASEGAFEKVVRDLQPLPPVEPCTDDDCYSAWGQALDVPNSVGRYTVHSATRVTGGIIFDTGEDCNWLDDAGIGWFPEGPDPARLETGSFERPEFTHLGGPWYRWCASW
ncbi:MAG: hypothetical protein ACT4QG_07255 [Sporichthyaceae bacterium]